MKARDVMTAPVITVLASASVKDVVKTLLKNHISAVPVVDDRDELVGIVSEGDLMRRSEPGPSENADGGCRWSAINSWPPNT